jgi:excisionase family DNA binding protein
MPDLEAAFRQIVAEVVRDGLQAFLGHGSTQTRLPDGGRRYVSPAQAAEIASVSPAAIRLWIHRGRLKHFRVGRLLRVAVDDLHAAMAAEPLTPTYLLARGIGGHCVETGPGAKQDPVPGMPSPSNVACTGQVPREELQVYSALRVTRSVSASRSIWFPATRGLIGIHKGRCRNRSRRTRWRARIRTSWEGEEDQSQLARR